MGRWSGLLWLTKEKLKVPGYWTMGGVTRTTHQGQFHREINFYAKTIEGKNQGPDRQSAETGLIPGEPAPAQQVLRTQLTASSEVTNNSDIQP